VKLSRPVPIAEARQALLPADTDAPGRPAEGPGRP